VRRTCQELTLGNLELIPDLSGALYVPEYSALLVADLHLEKGSSFLERGLHIPPFDTRSTLSVLESVVDRLQPRLLIALGDTFHDRGGPDRLDPADRDRITALARRREVVWIVGNHDPVLPADLGAEIVSEVSLGPLTLRHVPAAALDQSCEVAGHFHPVASVVARGRRLTARSFVADETRLVLPAFGAYTGGLNARAPEIASLFSGRFNVWMIGSEDIFTFASTALA
jgi:uncharacterized protein